MTFSLIPNIKLIATSQLEDVIQTFNKLIDSVNSTLQTFLNKPEITNTIQLTNVNLVAGNNLIQHGLPGRLTGWYITSINAASTIYDTQVTNKQVNYLALFSSAPCTVSLIVF